MHFSNSSDGFEQNWVRSCLANDYYLVNIYIYISQHYVVANRPNF